MTDIPFPRLTQITDSTAIGLVGYEPAQRLLLVGFVSTGSLWTYADVPPRHYAGLCAARSPGQYFNLHIRNRYLGARLAPLPRRVVPPRQLVSS